MHVPSALFQIIRTHGHTRTHVHPGTNAVPSLPPQELGSGQPPQTQPAMVIHACGHLSPSPAGGTRGRRCPPARLLTGGGGCCRAVPFGSAADGPGPNKPPKSADVPKAADTDGSALILPFSPDAREKR